MVISKTKIGMFFIAVLLIGWFLYPRELFLGFVYEGSQDLARAERFYLTYLAGHPHNKFATLRLVNLYERMGNPERGRTLLTNLYEHRPHDWSLAQEYVNFFKRLMDEEALYLARLKVIHNFLDHPHFSTGRLEQMMEEAYRYARWQQRYEVAYEHLLVLTRISRDPREYRGELEELDYALKKTDRIVARLRERLENNPNNLEARLELIGVLFAIDQPLEAKPVIQHGLKLHPTHYALLMRQYDIHELEQDFPGMMALLQRLVAHPECPAPHRISHLSNLAYLHIQSGQRDQGIKLYEDVLRLDPTRQNSWLGLIYAYVDAEQLDHVIELLESYLKQFPDDQKQSRYLVELYIYYKKDLSRLDAMRAAINQSLDTQLALAVGYLMWDQKQFLQARLWLEEMRDLFPQNQKVMTFLADVYRELKAHRSAIALLKVLLESDPQNELTLDQLAQTYGAIHRPDEALIYYKRLLKLSGLDRFKLKSIYKSIYFLGYAEQARDYFEKAHREFPADPEVTYYLYEIYRALNQPGPAQGMAERTLVLLGDQETSDPYWQRIALKVHAALKFDQGLRIDYERAIRARPTDWSLYYDYLDGLLEHREYARAFKYLKAARRDSVQGDPRLEFYWAHYYVLQQEWSQALPFLDQLIVNDPENWAVRSERAEVHRRLGRWDLALHDLELIKTHTRYLFDTPRRLFDLHRQYDDRTTVGFDYVDFGQDQLMQWRVKYQDYLTRSWRLNLETTVGRFQRPADNLDELDVFGSAQFTHHFSTKWSATFGLGYGFSSLKKTVNPELGIEYAPTDHWNFGLEARYRALRVDVPQAISAGALYDQFGFKASYTPWRRLDLFASYRFDRTYLNSGDSAHRQSLEPGLRLRVGSEPEFTFQYHFSFADVATNPAFQNRLTLIPDVAAHYLSVLATQRLREGYLIQAGGFVGHDEARGLDFFDGELWGLQASFDAGMLSWLDVRSKYLFSKEIVTGVAGRSHEVRFELSGHW